MRKILAAILLVGLVSSCNLISSLVHDDEVVARVGKNKLYKSEIATLIPDIISPEDSANLAARYIQSWALDRLYADVAEAELSKSEIDVSEELEAYKMSLIKYRYEQLYISTRLDTLVTEDQIKSYYTSHQEDFRLPRPVLKVRFLNIMKDSPSKDAILTLMASQDSDDLLQADTLARNSALRYFDASDTWMDAGELAKAFAVPYKDMLASMKDKLIQVEPEGRGDLLAAYVCDIRKDGIAPLEYCIPRIHDMILSQRKTELVAALERDLLSNALEKQKFEIY